MPTLLDTKYDMHQSEESQVEDAITHVRIVELPIAAEGADEIASSANRTCKTA